jgi:Flp pilus assembly protein TadG
VRLHRHGRGLDPPRDEYARPDNPVEQGSPRDRGSSTVEFVIASAAMVLLLLMVVQVGVWYHTRAVAQTAARHGLDHVRTINGSPSEGIDVASEFLDQSGGGLENRNIDATRTTAVSSVTVSGRVVSILPGVSFTVSVTVDAPTERIEP